MAQRVTTQTFAVAGAILEKDGKFLLIKEADAGVDTGKWNQPAGWIEVGEDPLESVVREVKEETGYDFVPTNILGIYSLFRKELSKHGIKIIYIGTIGETQAALAEDSSETKWFTPHEIYAMGPEVLRDLDIKQEVKDFLDGKKYPLGLLTHTIS